MYWPRSTRHLIHPRSLAPRLADEVYGMRGWVRLGSGVLVGVSSPPVPEPSAARALRRLVGEPIGEADRLDLRERPPGGTEHAEGMF